MSGLGELFICSPLSKADKHSLDREAQIIRIGKERCERKTYPHTIYPDMNRIQLRINGALNETGVHSSHGQKLCQGVTFYYPRCFDE